MHRQLQLKSLLLPGLLASALLLAGCGGGSDPASDSVVSPTSRGVIIGFGSVYIGEVKYETDDSDFDVDDDNTASENDLRVGHVCTVYGTINSDGVTGTADKISCDNELQGPISNKTPDAVDPSIGTMEILGTVIEVNADTRFEDGMTFAGFADGDCAEVSGFSSDNGITATHIEEDKDCSEIEITGEIADLADTSFTVRGVTINYDGNTELEDEVELVNGLYVEVKGSLDPADNTAILAMKVEEEEDGKGEDGDEFETQGIVSGYDDEAGTFSLNSITVKVGPGTEISPSTLDLSANPGPEVEVEGYWDGDILIADEIEQKGKKIEIQATTSSADTAAGTITFTFNNTDVVIRVNHQTEMEDEAGETPVDLLTLADFNELGGDFVELEAYAGGAGDINAVELHRKDELSETVIEAAVEGDATQPTVTVLGVEFDLTAALGNLKDDAGNTMTDADFFAELVEGVFVKLKDSDNNADIDSAELDD